MVIVAVEVLLVGSKPLAAVGVRITKGKGTRPWRRSAVLD